MKESNEVPALTTLWLTQQGQRSPTCIILVTPERLLSACTSRRGRKYILLNQHTNRSDRKLLWSLWVAHPWLRAFCIGSTLTSNHSTGKSPYSCSRKLSLEKQRFSKKEQGGCGYLWQSDACYTFLENSHTYQHGRLCLWGFCDVNVGFLTEFSLLFSPHLSS